LRYVLTKTIKGEKEDLVENAYINLNRISKVLYSKTFEYIVKKINLTVSNFESNDKFPLDQANRIGIIEFFGFEKKERNGFDQFVRNYANEVLNQFYINFNFKQQQDEIIKENIDWAKVNFTDNCDLLNLIDNTQDSVFSVIEKEGSKQEIKVQLDKVLNGKNSKIRFLNNFLYIKHYNGEVYYNVDDFLETNMDFLEGNISIVFEVANHSLLRSFFKKSQDLITKSLRNKMRKLYKLLYNNSYVLYVNCVNPYINQNEDINFNSICVNKQLKTIGLLEMLKIKKQSLPIKLSKENFVKDYLQLMTNSKQLNESTSNIEQTFKDVIFIVIIS
jgi:myosin heavy subunit